MRRMHPGWPDSDLVGVPNAFPIFLRVTRDNDDEDDEDGEEQDDGEDEDDDGDEGYSE